jgi:hypothetical protein
LVVIGDRRHLADSDLGSVENFDKQILGARGRSPTDAQWPFSDEREAGEAQLHRSKIMADAASTPAYRPQVFGGEAEAPNNLGAVSRGRIIGSVAFDRSQ